VAGAWLGFNLGNQLLAPVTAVVGAAILANLLLIVRDISWERRPAQPHDRRRSASWLHSDRVEDARWSCR
ncbi:MAG TPA: hypothetical protein VF148_02435, partial [Acidimicrobiia bacterium]